MVNVKFVFATSPFFFNVLYSKISNCVFIQFSHLEIAIRVYSKLKTENSSPKPQNSRVYYSIVRSQLFVKPKEIFETVTCKLIFFSTDEQAVNVLLLLCVMSAWSELLEGFAGSMVSANHCRLPQKRVRFDTLKPILRCLFVSYFHCQRLKHSTTAQLSYSGRMFFFLSILALPTRFLMILSGTSTRHFI